MVETKEEGTGGVRQRFSLVKDLERRQERNVKVSRVGSCPKIMEKICCLYITPGWDVFRNMTPLYPIYESEEVS